METKRKNYEEPQLVVIETEVKANILTESLTGGQGQAGEGDGDARILDEVIWEN
jgi:hypothetical protein